MKVALVLGGADCVWDDIKAAMDLGEFAGVVACNDVAAAWWGPLDALVTLHGEKAHMWVERRAMAGHPPAGEVFSHTLPRAERRPQMVTRTTEFRFPGQQASGSSGLFAGKVAKIDLGFDRIVFCGVPMAREHRHFDRDGEWRGAVSHRQGWREALPQLRDCARSMSGWTRELLGAPTPEWIGG